MLGKLIKQEWKGTYKIGGILLICMAVFTFLGCISLRMPLIHSAMTDSRTGVSFSVLDGMGIMTLVLYMLMLMGVTYGIIIFLGVHFYRSMYTDEGYLTHTLPVTTHQLLISKILISGIWMMIVTLSIVVSVVALAYAFLCMYLPATPAEITQELMRLFMQAWEEAQRVMGMDMVHFIITLALMVLVSPFSTMIMLFGSITLGQLFTKYRALMAIVCYIGVCIINMIVSSIVQMPLSMSYLINDDPMGYYMRTYDFSIVLSLLMSALLYFIAHMVLTKKFDIE